MNDDLQALASLVHRHSGIVVRDGQIASLRAALARVDPKLTAADVLRSPEPTHLARLVDQVAIKETFFLRHLEEVEGIDWPGKAARAAAAGRALRIWSAGCSTGEEAYSLALLAAEALGDEGPAIDVLGTDLSPSVLALAEQSLYGTRSMRLVDRRRRDRWFVADGARLRVGEKLRARVRFARHNLVHDRFPPEGEAPFDLVVCRNVLIYFDPPTAVRVTASLQQALAPGGRLLLGTVDRLLSGPPVGSPPPAGVVRQRPAARRARIEHGARIPRREATTRLLHPDSATSESPAEAAHAAFEAGSRALGAGDAATALTALRRALYLDPKRAVVALQLARAHEALDQVEAARRAYWRTLRLVDETPDSGARVYDRIAAGDVAAACRARLTVLSGPAAHARPRLIES
jgi:chemotaxis protein methyltransferase CheR